MKLFVCILCVLILSGCLKEQPSAIVGSIQAQKAAVASFKTVDYDGLETLLVNSTAEVTVVNFWATWCKPCIKELPYFEQVSTNYDDREVDVILVSLDFPNQKEHLENFITKRHLKSEVILLDDADANRWINEVDESWSGALPATLLYNHHKRSFFERSFTFQELELEIEKFKS